MSMQSEAPTAFKPQYSLKLALSLLSLVVITEISARDIYAVDDSPGLGRPFDGIGAISGGGATSKLLETYPEKQRDEVLDFLFTPNFGASLHILKVEIGGDGQSTEGTESSHMHEEWDENYDRGYEWWMMVEAKKRNPHIKLYGLAWSFPGYLGGGSNWPYTNCTKTAVYIINWIRGAKVHYNLTIDYIGIWNEKPYTTEYVKTLRKMLDSSGFPNVEIVAADLIGGVDWPWSVVFDMETDPEFNNSVSYVGAHYTGTSSIEEAKVCGKPLWSSEDSSSTNDWTGGGCMARLANQNYVNGYMTSTIAWNLIASYYSHLPDYPRGLMTANSPWSGHYDVRSPIWTTAHTTQFTEIGWRYLQHGHGVGLLRHGGSYVSLVSPDKKGLTIIIETMNPSHGGFCVHPPVGPYTTSPQNVTFALKLTGSLANITSLEYWYTLLDPHDTSTVFKKMSPIQVTNGQFSVNLLINRVYTFTTLKTGRKGSHGSIPAEKPFPLPYSDNFDSTKEFHEARYFTQQIGSFEVRKSTDSKHNMVLRQVVINTPVHWCPTMLQPPIGVIGNYSWANITLTADVYVGPVNATESVFIATRVDRGGCQTMMAKGIFFFLNVKKQQWQICQDLECTMKAATGSAKLSVGTWYTMSLTTVADRAVAELDGKLVFTQTLTGSVKNGFAALGTGQFGLADFDNLAIKQM